MKRSVRPGWKRYLRTLLTKTLKRILTMRLALRDVLSLPIWICIWMHKCPVFPYQRGNLKIFVHRESLVNVGLCSQCMFCRRNASSPAVANVYACFYCSTETSSHINAGHFQPSSVETSSDEYRSHNNTESDIEINGCVAVIEDVNVVRCHELIKLTGHVDLND